MAWGTIRKATDEDVERLKAAEARFHGRYGVDIEDIEYAIRWGGLPTEQGYLTPEHAKYLRRLYYAAVRRALREPGADGIAWGYVGYHAP